jgi:hypothetical protein
LNIAESDCVCNRGFSGPAGGPCVLWPRKDEPNK